MSFERKIERRITIEWVLIALSKIDTTIINDSRFHRIENLEIWKKIKMEI